LVSLPSGVFNPYAGVKTSILFLDKTLAKKSDSILFVKIENDGFDLGAQRRPNGKSDLPEAARSILDYVSEIRNGETFDAQNIGNVLVVAKEKIGGNGDWNLSGERYRENNELRNSNYDLKSFNEVCTLEYGASLPKRNRIAGDYPVVGSNGITGYHNEFLIEGPSIIVGRKGSAGEVVLIKDPCYPIDTTYYIKRNNPEECDLIYLYHVLSGLDLPTLKDGAGIPGLNRNDVYEKFKIPLPPLEIQKEIVAEIEGYRKIIDGARAVVENYKPHIQIDPEWEMVELREVCEINPKKSQISHLDRAVQVSFVPMADVNENEMYFNAKETRELDGVFKGYTYFQNDDVLLAKVTPCFENGKASLANHLTNGIGFGSSEFYVFRASEKILPAWIFHNVTTDRFKNEGKLKMTGTGGLQRVPKDFIEHYKIPLPPLETQSQIVERIEKEQALVNANKELIAIFEQKIKDKIASVWGE